MPVLFALLATLIVIGVIGMLVLAARNGSPEIDAVSGTLVFRHGWLLRAFAVAALFGGETLFGVWAVIYPPKSPGTSFALAAGAAVLGFASLLLCWEAYRFGLVVSPGELDCRSPWRGRTVVPWAGVKDVSFSRANAWFVINTTAGGSFRVSAVVPGVGRFLEACEKNLTAEQLRPAKGGYAWAGRKWPHPERR